MRGSLTFALSALALFFLVQGLGALFVVFFAVAYDAVFPRPSALAALLVLPPIACLLTPWLPFSLWIERPKALALGATGAAAGRVLLCWPAFAIQYVGAILTVAAGALFLAKAVGYLDRHKVAAALALAFVLDALLRVAGGGYSSALRAGWLPVQLALSAATVLLLAVWLRDPAPEEEGGDARTLERRQGGLRLRGALSLAVLLFFELNLLSRPEVAARWTGVSYRAAATALIAAGAAALVLLLTRPPLARHRPRTLVLVALATLGAAFADIAPLGAAGRLTLFVLAHASALVLFGRAVQPASGRRRGWTLAAGLSVLLVLNVLLGFTFFYAFTAPIMQGGLRPLVLTAGVLLAAMLALIPRPLKESSLGRHVLAVPAAVAFALVAWLVTPTAPPAAAPVGDTVTVATWNVHYGFDEHWRYDPERIARTIEESGAHVVALQEVPAGMLTAHGTDLARWLGDRLGMRALFAPAINGVLGDAVLTRLPVADFAVIPLPPARADRKTAARTRLVVRGTAEVDTLTVLTTHFGLEPDEQAVQVAAALARLAGIERAVFMGDLNAGEDSGVARALRAAGFRDAFELAGARARPTAPASRPAARIDWIWLRGLDAASALVSAGAGSDHRLVAATVRMAARETPAAALPGSVENGAR
jgi:endonuclease/exonuclease/phosphatase family metal-dependent hydrolase